MAKGYVRFFEPDVYVETEKGLLEEAGLGALRKEHTLHPQVITLKEFLEPERGRDWSDPAFGLNIHDVLTHIYKTQNALGGDPAFALGIGHRHVRSRSTKHSTVLV